MPARRVATCVVRHGDVTVVVSAILATEPEAAQQRDDQGVEEDDDHESMTTTGNGGNGAGGRRKRRKRQKRSRSSQQHAGRNSPRVPGVLQVVRLVNHMPLLDTEAALPCPLVRAVSDGCGRRSEQLGSEATAVSCFSLGYRVGPPELRGSDSCIKMSILVRGSLCMMLLGPSCRALCCSSM